MGSVSLIDGHIDNDTPRMTDEQIIQAYACCNISDFGGCDNCPCQIEDECIIRTKGFDLEREVFNVFNHQKAEIEMLQLKIEGVQEANAILREHIRKAVKEFAERLKEYVESYDVTTGYKITIVYAVEEETIDNLVKEMVGDLV